MIVGTAAARVAAATAADHAGAAPKGGAPDVLEQFLPWPEARLALALAWALGPIVISIATFFYARHKEKRADKKTAARLADAERKTAERFRQVDDQRERHHSEEKRRELRLRNAAVYLQLEVHSSEVFKFTAEKAQVLKPYRCATRPDGMAEDEQARETALNLYFQSLNLFEVAARMKRNNLFPDDVFASWVAWFLEVLDSWFFRAEWDEEIRPNYTTDVRRIFDIGCDIFRREPDVDAREAAFYRAVAYVMTLPSPFEDDPVDAERLAKSTATIANWPADLKERMTWAQVPTT